MRNELAFGVIVGLICGSGLVAPEAANKPISSSFPKNMSAGAKVLPATAVVEKPLSHYEMINKRDLFKPAIAPIDTPPRTASRDLPIFETTQRKTSPTEGWSFAGYASIDGVMLAILQEPSSGQAVFLREGEGFRGGIVEDISTNSVRLSFGDESDILYKSLEYNTVPLSTSATQARTAPRYPREASGFQPNRSSSSRHVTSSSGTMSIDEARAAAHERAARIRSGWEARRERLMRNRHHPPFPPDQQSIEDQQEEIIEEEFELVPLEEPEELE